MRDGSIRRRGGLRWVVYGRRPGGSPGGRVGGRRRGSDGRSIRADDESTQRPRHSAWGPQLTTHCRIDGHGGSGLRQGRQRRGRRRRGGRGLGHRCAGRRRLGWPGRVRRAGVGRLRRAGGRRHGGLGLGSCRRLRGPAGLCGGRDDGRHRAGHRGQGRRRGLCRGGGGRRWLYDGHCCSERLDRWRRCHDRRCRGPGWLRLPESREGQHQQDHHGYDGQTRRSISHRRALPCGISPTPFRTTRRAATPPPADRS